MRELSIETPTHGRVLVKKTSGVVSEKRLPMSAPPVVLIGFHGYAQSAEDMMVELQALPGSEAWTLVSVQALNRFYTRGDSAIVANWMTRQDREQTIADNVVYTDRVLDVLLKNDIGSPFSETTPDVFLLGFSQGVAMAYRAALLGRHRVAGIIAVGGDIPPDVKSVPAERWPRLLIAAGSTDHWYTPEKVAADETFLRTHGVPHELLHYDAGHIFTDVVRARVSAFVR
jgi:predicted esterase